MKRTKTPTLQKKRKKPGPKSGCTPEVVQHAYKYALLGLTNWQMSRLFNVDESTITYWYKTQDVFRQAIDQGRHHADAQVADALYQRAIGYQHDAVKFFKDTVTEKEYDEEGNVISERSYGRIIKQPYTKQYPPDVKAAIKWLGVRNRETWGESIKVSHEHEHKHLHLGKMHIEINHVMEQISDTALLSDEELELVTKLGLDNLQKQIEAGSHD